MSFLFNPCQPCCSLCCQIPDTVCGYFLNNIEYTNVFPSVFYKDEINTLLFNKNEQHPKKWIATEYHKYFTTQSGIYGLYDYNVGFECNGRNRIGITAFLPQYLEDYLNSPSGSYTGPGNSLGYADIIDCQNFEARYPSGISVCPNTRIITSDEISCSGKHYLYTWDKTHYCDGQLACRSYIPVPKNPSGESISMYITVPNSGGQSQYTSFTIDSNAISIREPDQCKWTGLSANVYNQVTYLGSIFNRNTAGYPINRASIRTEGSDLVYYADGSGYPIFGAPAVMQEIRYWVKFKRPISSLDLDKQFDLYYDSSSHDLINLSNSNIVDNTYFIRFLPTENKRNYYYSTLFQRDMPSSLYVTIDSDCSYLDGLVIELFNSQITGSDIYQGFKSFVVNVFPNNILFSLSIRINYNTPNSEPTVSNGCETQNGGMDSYIELAVSNLTAGGGYLQFDTDTALQIPEGPFSHEFTANFPGLSAVTFPGVCNSDFYITSTITE